MFDEELTEEGVATYWNYLKAYYAFRAWLFTPYWRLRAWLFRFEPFCGYGCGWEAPYGFVPEAGCPKHDCAAPTASGDAGG